MSKLFFAFVFIFQFSALADVTETFSGSDEDGKPCELTRTIFDDGVIDFNVSYSQRWDSLSFDPRPGTTPYCGFDSKKTENGYIYRDRFWATSGYIQELIVEYSSTGNNDFDHSSEIGNFSLYQGSESLFRNLACWKFRIRKYPLVKCQIEKVTEE